MNKSQDMLTKVKSDNLQPVSEEKTWVDADEGRDIRVKLDKKDSEKIFKAVGSDDITEVKSAYVRTTGSGQIIFDISV